MELLLLVGTIVKGAVYVGYGITGTYFVKTGFRYIKDYKNAIENERA